MCTPIDLARRRTSHSNESSVEPLQLYIRIYLCGFLRRLPDPHPVRYISGNVIVDILFESEIALGMTSERRLLRPGTVYIYPTRGPDLYGRERLRSGRRLYIFPPPAERENIFPSRTSQPARTLTRRILRFLEVPRFIARI